MISVFAIFKMSFFAKQYSITNSKWYFILIGMINSILERFRHTYEVLNKNIRKIGSQEGFMQAFPENKVVEGSAYILRVSQNDEREV